VLRRLRILRRKLIVWHRLPRFEQLWLLPVWCLLGLSRLLILTMPFRRLAPYLGRHLGNDAVIPLLSAHQQARALHIGRVVRLAAQYTPWESNCFSQAVAVRVLLGGYGISYTLCFGLARTRADSEELQAHAWVAAGPVCVSGGDGFRQFTVVGVFVSHDLTAQGKGSVHPGQLTTLPRVRVGKNRES
jgi:hypothetical protein